MIVNAVSVGRFEPFDLDTLTFDAHLEHLNQFFIANDVTNVDKQKAILITSLSSENYQLLTNFFSPDSPMTATYSELCTRLRDHFVPEKVEVAEGNRFYQRNQHAVESVKDFLADLRHRAKDCNLVQAKLFILPPTEGKRVTTYPFSRFCGEQNWNAEAGRNDDKKQKHVKAE